MADCEEILKLLDIDDEIMGEVMKPETKASKWKSQFNAALFISPLSLLALDFSDNGILDGSVFHLFVQWLT